MNQAIKQILSRLQRDESGAALTEFVMVLPVFIMVFAGIGYLGSFERASTKTWGSAYRDTWRKAIPVQKGDGESHHRSHQSGGSRAISDINTYEVHNRVDAARGETGEAESRTYEGTRSGGDFGESGRRVERAQKVVSLPALDNAVSTSADTSIQGSEVGANLFGDPALLAEATGGRYGVAHGIEERTHEVGHFQMEMRAHFNVLVAPVGASGDTTAEIAASGIDGLAPYDDLMGIAWDQPLPGEEVRVDPIVEGEE